MLDEVSLAAGWVVVASCLFGRAVALTISECCVRWVKRLFGSRLQPLDSPGPQKLSLRLGIFGGQLLVCQRLEETSLWLQGRVIPAPQGPNPGWACGRKAQIFGGQLLVCVFFVEQDFSECHAAAKFGANNVRARPGVAHVAIASAP